MDWLVKLTKDTLNWVKQAKEQRNLLKRDAGVRDRKVGPQNSLEMDDWGTRCEAAYCQLYGLPFNHKITLSGDGGCWDTIHNGAYIEIKGRFPKTSYGKKPNYFLVTRETYEKRWCREFQEGDPIEKHPPDYIVCVHPIDDDTMKLVGWVSLKQFKERCEAAPWDKKNQTIAIHEDKLNQMDDYPIK